MDEKLKPCPLCGKSGAVWADAQDLEACENFEGEDCPSLETKQVHLGDDAKGCPYVIIVCDFNKGGCGASSGFRKSVQEAIEAWNRRADNGRG